MILRMEMEMKLRLLSAEMAGAFEATRNEARAAPTANRPFSALL